MTPERRAVLIDHVAERLGSVRMWRVTILSGIALPLLLAVVVIAALH